MGAALQGAWCDACLGGHHSEWRSVGTITTPTNVLRQPVPELVDRRRRGLHPEALADALQVLPDSMGRDPETTGCTLGSLLGAVRHQDFELAVGRAGANGHEANSAKRSAEC